MKISAFPTLLILCAAVLISSCGGRNPSTSPAADSNIDATADEDSRHHPFHRAGTNDLLILTPSDENLDESEIAIAINGLAISKREFNAGLARFREDNPDTTNAEDVYRREVRKELLLLAYVRDELAMREEDFRYRARAELRESIAALVLEKIVDSRIAISESDLRARYERDRQLWVQAPRVIIELILVASNSEAQALIARIEAGENFGDLARAFSLHGSRERDGRLEPFRRGTYSSSLEDVAFRLRPGEIDTAETERGVFIVRKIADSSETVAPFADVRDQIEEIIRNEREQSERQAFMAELESRYSEKKRPMVAVPSDE